MIAYTAKQAIAADTAVMAAAADEAVDPEAPATRMAYDIKTKFVFVQTIDTLISSSKSRRTARAFVGIPPLYYHRWRRLLAKIDDVNATEEFVADSTKGTARKIHHSCTRGMTTIRPELEAFMFKICEQGIQLTNRMVG